MQPSPSDAVTTIPSPPKTCAACGKRFRRGEMFCPNDGTLLTERSARPQPKVDPLIGLTLDGRYRVQGIIGEGGMGIVYEAEHVLIDRTVAVKVLRQDFTRKPDVVERFRQEARSVSRIGHPNIVDVLDFGETPFGSKYFVMEKLVGEDLAEVLSRECVLAPARAVFLIHQCCKALQAAHEKGVFHRDLKPENLFLIRTEDKAEKVKVVDFGVAKMTDQGNSEGEGGRRLTRTGMLFGTPEYMCPEQAKGLVLDARADIYSLGIILYELVTGRVPFEGKNFMEVLNKHAQVPVPPLVSVNPGTKVSTELEAVILRALEKDRDTRFPSMAEMAAALSAVPEMPSAGATAGPPPWALSPPTSKPLRTTSSSPEPAVLPGPAPTATDLRWERPTRRLSQARSKAPWLAVASAAALIGAVVISGLSRRSEKSAPLTESHPSTRALSRSVQSAVAAKPVADGVGNTDPAPIAAATAEPGVQEQRSVTTSDASREGRLSIAGASQEPVVAAPVDPPRGLATPVKPGSAEVETVSLVLTSSPPGARVIGVDMGELCAATPCEVSFVKGKSTALQYMLGEHKVSIRVNPKLNGQKAFVTFQSRLRSGGTVTPAEAAAPRTAPEPSRSDDLKTPEFYLR